MSIALQAKVAGIIDDPIRSSDVEHENQFISLPNASSHRARNTKLEKTMRLRRNQLCPIHRSHFCCGREQIPREKCQRRMGIRRIEDPQHPRGYRELRSNGEMRKLLDRKIVSQNGICALCNGQFTNYSDVVPDHIHPKGMGGAWRDDHPDNIQAVHWWCNGEKGSARL